jgi:hypothetical protein
VPWSPSPAASDDFLGDDDTSIPTVAVHSTNFFSLFLNEDCSDSSPPLSQSVPNGDCVELAWVAGMGPYYYSMVSYCYHGIAFSGFFRSIGCHDNYHGSLVSMDNQCGLAPTGVYARMECNSIYSSVKKLPSSTRGRIITYRDESCKIPIAGPYTLDGDCVSMSDPESAVRSINGAIIGSHFVLANFESLSSCQGRATGGRMDQLNKCIRHSDGFFFKVVPADATIQNGAGTNSPTSAGAIAGGVIGGIIVLVAIVVGVVLYRKRSRGTTKSSSASNSTSATPALSSPATVSACAVDPDPISLKQSAVSPPSETDCDTDPAPVCP